MPFIKGKRIVLREFRQSDADDLVDAFSDKDMTRWLITVPYPYHKKHAVNFIRRSAYRLKRKHTYTFAIDIDGHIVGGVSLKDVKWKDRRADIGYWIRKDCWGKGYMTEAVNMVVDYAFNKLKLHRIFGQCFEDNPASAKVMLKCGFKPEGKAVDEECKDGKYHNILKFGIINKKG